MAFKKITIKKQEPAPIKDPAQLDLEDLIARVKLNDPIWNARKKLDLPGLNNPNNQFHKIANYDPSKLYLKIDHLIKPFERFQHVSMQDMFYNEPGVCACGCGFSLTGRQRRWATIKCVEFPLLINGIINGRTDVIYRIISYLFGDKCCQCGKGPWELTRSSKSDYRNPLELEHTLAVCNGGGGSWLSNYKIMCYKCHKFKTNSDLKSKRSSITTIATQEKLL